MNKNKYTKCPVCDKKTFDTIYDTNIDSEVNIKGVITNNTFRIDIRPEHKYNTLDKGVLSICRNKECGFSIKKPEKIYILNSFQYWFPFGMLVLIGGISLIDFITTIMR